MNFPRVSDCYVEIPSVQFVVICKDPDNNANSLRCLLFLIFKFFYVWHQKTTCHIFSAIQGKSCFMKKYSVYQAVNVSWYLQKGEASINFAVFATVCISLWIYNFTVFWSHQKGSLLLLLLAVKQQTGITTYFTLLQKGKHDIMVCRETLKVWSRWLLST